MKTYELFLTSKDGDADSYYRRLAGHGWESDADLDSVIDEIRKYDPEIWEYLQSEEATENLRGYLIAEVDPETGDPIWETLDSYTYEFIDGDNCKITWSVIDGKRVNLGRWYWYD